MKCSIVFYTLIAVAICLGLYLVNTIDNLIGVDIELFKVFMESVILGSITILIIMVIEPKSLQATFPTSYNEECFDCNRSDCNNCPFK